MDWVVENRRLTTKLGLTWKFAAGSLFLNFMHRNQKRADALSVRKQANQSDC
jgi:hypothetical protein